LLRAMAVLVASGVDFHLDVVGEESDAGETFVLAVRFRKNAELHFSIGAWLMANYRIVNTPILHPEFNGIRITPNVYTTTDEIDTFADAVTTAIKKGIG